jgi:hypothetical protein
LFIIKALTLHAYLINDFPPVCTCCSKVHEVDTAGTSQPEPHHSN